MSFLRFCNFSRLNYLLALILILPLVGCGSSGSGSATGDIVLSWSAPSARENNNVLVLSEIAGYRIYYGNEPGDYRNTFDINDGAAVQAKILEVSSGTYYVVMTAIDTDGLESTLSDEVIVTI